MLLRNVVALIALIAFGGSPQLLSATEGPPGITQAPCGPQPCCNECVSYSCKLVPEVKQIKKTVYEVKEVPFCVKKLPPLCSLFGHHDCGCEPCCECQCPRFKKVLVKKEIVCKEICTSKCVIEEHRVPRCTCGPCQQ